MSRNEQKLYIDYIADLYIEAARRYEHSCIFLQSISGADDEANQECLRTIREKSGNEYALVMHGDSTYAVPNGDKMMDFSTRMFEDPDGLKQEAEGRLRRAVEWAKKYRGALDGFASVRITVSTPIPISRRISSRNSYSLI